MVTLNALNTWDARSGGRCHFGDTVPPPPTSRKPRNLCVPQQITEVATFASIQTRIARHERLVQKVALGALDARLLFLYCSFARSLGRPQT